MANLKEKLKQYQRDYKLKQYQRDYYASKNK